MAERCLTLGCPEAVRLALEDPCSGEVIPGLTNGYVATCIRNWTIEPIVREGEASEFISDCGNMVVRDRQDDQLLGYTVSFETSVRSSELEALVTGGVVIPSDGLNIGTYKVASNLACDTESEDPRFVIEAFYKLARCVASADHVRVVLPMAQFKVTELDREGTLTFFRFTAETGIAPANAFGEGPYGDFPEDITDFLDGRDPDEFTASFDFEESITITGSCGYVEVPDPDPLVCFAITGAISESPDPGITIFGTGFLNMCGISMDFYDLATGGSFIGGQQYFNPASVNNAQNIINSNVITWTDTAITVSNSTVAFASFDGLFVQDVYGNACSDIGLPCPAVTINLDPGEEWVA